MSGDTFMMAVEWFLWRGLGAEVENGKWEAGGQSWGVEWSGGRCSGLQLLGASRCWMQCNLRIRYCPLGFFSSTPGCQWSRGSSCFLFDAEVGAVVDDSGVSSAPCFSSLSNWLKYHHRISTNRVRFFIRCLHQTFGLLHDADDVAVVSKTIVNTAWKSNLLSRWLQQRWQRMEGETSKTIYI